MAGAIIENMSGRKLAMIGSFLLICQIVCFLVGAILAPNPNSSDQYIGAKCYNEDGGRSLSETWFYQRGKGQCTIMDRLDSEDIEAKHVTENNVVFAFQMPHARDNINHDFTRWQQNLIGVLMVDIEYQEEDHEEDEEQKDDEQKDDKMLERIHFMLHAKLGYRNKEDPEDKWTEYAHSFEARNLDCEIEKQKQINGYHYECNILPLFELGSLHHDYYLLNIKIPTVYLDGENVVHDINTNLGKLVDLNLVTIIQNGGFTKVWVSLKTIFFPIILCEMFWFWRRVHQLARPPNLLEKMLLCLGAALTFLNLPMEFFTLAYDMPWLNLFNDIKQGVFYAALLVFWLIFAGEHQITDTGVGESSLMSYWKNLLVVLFGCLCLFVFDMCERGVQLQNPFFSIWVTELGTNLALGFIILAGISAGLYFIFLCYMIYKVFSTISGRAASISNMSRIRRMHYQGIIWRFKFLMLATLLTAALTVIGFIIGQVAEGAYKWDTEPQENSLEYTSGFMTGVYGMWNIYIFGLLFLYAPSHKHWGDEDTTSTGEEVEFDVGDRSGAAAESSEMSSLTNFIQHQATD